MPVFTIHEAHDLKVVISSDGVEVTNMVTGHRCRLHADFQIGFKLEMLYRVIPVSDPPKEDNAN